MKEIQKILLVLLIGIAASVQANNTNNVTCGVNEVEWHPHPTDCGLFLICFHGVVHTMQCAPGK